MASDVAGIPSLSHGGAQVALRQPGEATEIGRGGIPAAPRTDGPSPFARLVRGLATDVERGESLTRAALSMAGCHGDLGPGDLIALQVGICRYSEALDLAARLVDRSTASVKTVLQGQ